MERHLKYLLSLPKLDQMVIFFWTWSIPVNIEIKKIFSLFAFAFRLVQFYNFLCLSYDLKKCVKMCLFGRMPYFPEIDKAQKSGLLGERLWVYSSILVQFLREGDSLWVTFSGGGGGEQFTLVSPFPDQSQEKSWQIWMIEYHKDSPATSRKPKIASWATYIFNQNFIVSPNYKRRHPRKWIRIFPFLFKMFSLNPIRAGGPC